MVRPPPSLLYQPLPTKVPKVASVTAFAHRTLASLMRGNAKSCELPWHFEKQPSRRVNGEDICAPSVQVECFTLDDGSKALIYWNSVDLLTSTYEGTVSFDVFDVSEKDVSLLDLKDGSVYMLPDGMVESLGVHGVRFRNLPITDSPLALLFRK